MKTVHVVCKALLVLSVLLTGWVQASVRDELVLNLYRLERCGVMAASDYARSDRAGKCQEIFEETDTGIEQLSDQLSGEQVSVIQESWSLIKDVYSDALDDLTLFRSHYTINDLRAGRDAIIEQLADDLPQSPNPLATAVLIEQMAAEYIWRAESAWGGGTTENAQDIAVWVKEVDQQIAPLQQNYAESYDLRSAIKKYQFIRGSLINYNVNSVPYVVDRYASEIVDALLSVSRS